MKLKKVLVPLFVVLVMGLSTAAFADVTCAVTTVPAARDIVNGHWENTGDLTFTCTPNDPDGAGPKTAADPTGEISITVFYGATIVNTPVIAGGIGQVPAAAQGHNIVVTNTVGTAGAALDGSRQDTGTTGVTTSGLVGIVIAGMANPTVTCAPTCTFTLSNVVLSLNGAVAAGSPLVASVNLVTSSGNVNLTGAPITVISQVLPPFNSTTQPPALAAGTNPAQFTAAGAILPPSAACSTVACQNARASFAVTLTEDHIDTWRSIAQYYNNASGTPLNPTTVIYTFSGMLPGSVISNCVVASSSGAAWVLTGNGIAGSTGTTTLVAEATGAQNLATVDTLTLTCGSTTATPAYTVGSSTGSATGDIKVTMQPGPTGTALSALGAVQTSGGVPRYNATGATVGPVTVISFGGGAGGQTSMLIPWVTATGAASPAAGTFNTGVTIANTTKDPAAFGTDAQGAAPDSTGGLTFVFFPADSTQASFTITPTTGFGLQGGVLPPGASFIGNFSDILKAGNVTTAFSGYVFIIANFTHAHGTAFVYGGSAADRITSAQELLTIGTPITTLGWAGRGLAVTGGVLPGGVEITSK